MNDDDFSPERCNPDIKRLSYADHLSRSNDPKNSIVSEYECNRFGVIYAIHHSLISQQIEDTEGDIGPVGMIHSPVGLRVCMKAIDRIWDSRPSVDGIHRNQTVSICKPGNVVVPSAGAIPGLATAEETKKPGALSRLVGFVRGPAKTTE